MADDAVELKYIGDGTQIGKVQTRDLTHAEVALYDRNALLKSGLYKEVKKIVYSSKPVKSAQKSTANTEEE